MKLQGKNFPLHPTVGQGLYGHYTVTPRNAVLFVNASRGSFSLKSASFSYQIRLQRSPKLELKLVGNQQLSFVLVMSFRTWLPALSRYINH